MRIEYGLGHRNGTVDGPYETEEEMYNQLLKLLGSPVGRLVWENRIGPWKDIDPVNGLCYAPSIYKKSSGIKEN